MQKVIEELNEKVVALLNVVAKPGAIIIIASGDEDSKEINGRYELRSDEKFDGVVYQKESLPRMVLFSGAGYAWTLAPELPVTAEAEEEKVRP